MCVARAAFAYYTLRGNPLNTLPFKPKAGDGCGAPQVMSCDGEVLSKEGCWTRRWVFVGCCRGSWLIPPTASLQGAQQKHSPSPQSLCYLLIESSCRWLCFREASRRRRGRLGRNGNSSVQEVDRVSFIFTKGEGKSLRRIFPGRK